MRAEEANKISDIECDIRNILAGHKSDVLTAVETWVADGKYCITVWGARDMVVSDLMDKLSKFGYSVVLDGQTQGGWNVIVSLDGK